MMPLKLVVRSSFFQVNDSLGLSLSRAGATAIPFIVAPGKAATIFNFTITGTDR